MRSLLAVALVATWIAPAVAQTPGVHLSWSECLPKGGTRNMDFSCGTADGVETLLMTFSPEVPASQVFGLEARIDISTLPTGGVGPVLPSWWQLELGGCRYGSMTFSLDYTHPPYSVGAACVDPWQSNGSGAFDYGYPSTLASSSPSTAVIRMVGAVPTDKYFPVVPGTEYYAFRFMIDNQKTVGLAGGACDGCCTPMYLAPIYLKIGEPVGVGDFTLYGTAADVITWQGSGSACGPTPARRHSWGMVKSLYR